MSLKKYRLPIILGILVIGVGYFVLRSPLARVEDGIYVTRGLDVGSGLLWSPDGNYLAGSETIYPWPDCPIILTCFLAPEPYSELFLIDTTSWERKSLVKTEFYDRIIYATSWHPDGKHIAYHSEGNKTGDWGEIRLIDIKGQDDIAYLDGSRNLIWNPSGTLLASLETEGVSGDWYPAIYIIDVLTNQKKQIFKADKSNSGVFNLSWSSNGKTLAFSFGKLTMENPAKFNIFLYNTESKEITQLTDDQFEYEGAFFSPTDNLIALQRFNKNAVDFEHRYTTAIRDLSSNCEVELPLVLTLSSSWSPDGKKLIITGVGKAYLVDLVEFIGPEFNETGSICSK